MNAPRRTESAIRTLVLYAQYTTRLSYYDDWLEAFAAAPQFATTALNICAGDIATRLKRELAEAELVVLLHSTNGDTTIYLEPIAPLLATRRGLLLSFVGNELNLPGSPIAAKRAVLRQIRPDFIATQMLREAGEYLFGDLAGRGVLAVPHALNPAAFKPERDAARRPIDIGVRAVRYLPHLGDDDRNRMHEFFSGHAFDSALKTDIGDARLDRAGWAAFLNACKATVSTEAGSWFIERDDATIEAIRAYIAERFKGKGIVIANDSPLRRLGHALPYPVRAMLRKILSAGPVRHELTINENLPFDKIFQRFFAGKPRPPVYSKCISSRHFDAIGTKTVQIMFPGRFNDILETGTHYIALERDFSNIAGVMAQFRDPARRAAIADAAYGHVRARHTYAHRMAAIYDAVAASASKPAQAASV